MNSTASTASIAINKVAAKIGCDIEFIGENGKSGDERVVIYRIGSVRVAETNGDPVWETVNPDLFEELLQSECIKL